MAILHEEDIIKIEEYYYWSGYIDCTPFPMELKKMLLEVYGKEPLPHSWTEQDIHEGSRKIILRYFSGNKIL